MFIIPCKYNDKSNYILNLVKEIRSFHPNENTASVSINTTDFIRFLNHMGNSYEFLPLYE
jgi:hypothetical protein